jgi:hypothetical protein
MPTPEQVERSRERNRQRGYDEKYIAECLARPDPEKLRREAAAGPRYCMQGPALSNGPYKMGDSWGGSEPPAAA